MERKIIAYFKDMGFDAKLLLADGTRYHVSNMKEAADIIEDAIRNNRFICVVGDYDVDGIKCGRIMDIILTYKGAKFVIRLPKRFSEGYGLSKSIIDEIPDNSLLITVDNGITAIDEISLAKERGITVIVIDHHQIRDDGLLPDADCIVNPHYFNFGAPNEYPHYCGAGLCHMLAKEMKLPKHLLNQTTVLAAIATIADIVPLTGNNRNIVKKGLELLNSKSVDLPELYSLCSALNLTPTTEKNHGIDEKAVAFYIAPCINAMGRMLDNGANEAFEYLRNFSKHGNVGIQKIISCNNERKRLTNFQTGYLLQMCEEILEENPLMGCIVVYAQNLHEGLLGLMAPKIVDKYHRPAIVLTNTPSGLLKGSARSIPDVDIKKALDESAEFIEKYGGHAGAAGLTVHPEKLDQFILAMNFAVPVISDEPSQLFYDIEISASEISKAYDTLHDYAPFGAAFPTPIFRIPNCKIVKNDKNPTGIFYFKNGGFSLQLTDFKAACLTPNPPLLDKLHYFIEQMEYADVYGTLGYDTYKGNDTPMVYLLDVWPSANHSE